MQNYNLFQDRANIAKNAICSYVIFQDDNRLTDEQFEKVLNYIHPITLKYIDDISFIRNERLKRFIDYSRLDRKQLIRLMTRDIKILYKLDLKHFNFSISELEHFVLNYADHVRYFNFDLSSITGKEVIILLKCDLNFIYEIDIQHARFSRLEFIEIIQEFSNIEAIMNILDFNKFDNFLNRMVLTLTNDRYIHKVNLGKLNCLDWLEILKVHPDLIQYCDISIFETGDYFKMAQLICLIPDLDYLLTKHYEEISALAWERLLAHDEQKYSSICNFKIFKEINWRNAIKKNPSLAKLKLKINYIS